jgi:hypothetical protein
VAAVAAAVRVPNATSVDRKATSLAIAHQLVDIPEVVDVAVTEVAEEAASVMAVDGRICNATAVEATAT